VTAGYGTGGYGASFGFAPCYRHPERATGVRCIRCDRPICPECQRPASVGFQCPDDVRAGQASVRSARTVVGAVASARPPVVSYLLIAVNVLAYLATSSGNGATVMDNRPSTLFSDWVMYPYGVTRDHEYYRLITSAFLHIGPIHLLFNMFALYMLGPGLERVLGWWRFSAVYLLAALGGSVASLVAGAVLGGSAGASGAIFGLFAAALLLYRVLGLEMRSLVITVAINFVFTFSVPGISKLGHVGGFVAGGLATLAVLGWTVRRGSLRRVDARFQAAGLLGVALLLLLIAVVRIVSLANYQAA
jgi:membrane associated rhomboid family serine protease